MPNHLARRSGISPSAAFSPANVSGLVAWFKADSLGLSDGDPIASWADSSGHGNTATQTGGLRPTFKAALRNGLPIVRCTAAANQYMATAAFSQGHIAQPITVIVAAKPTGTSGWEFDGLTDPGHVGVAMNQFLYKGAGTPAYIASTVWEVDTFIFRSGSFQVYRNGSSITAPSDAGSNYLDGLTINARFSGGGTDADYGEILVYSADLSTTDRQALESYLRAKWGV